MSLNSVVIIPARYASYRLPGKPLVEMAGKPLIQWVYEQALEIKNASEVIIVTDDERVEAAAKNFGAKVLMSPSNLASGSERVGFVAQNLDYEIIVNLQGDELFISTDVVDEAIEVLKNDSTVNISTAACPIKTEDEWRDPSAVKVLIDTYMNAVYFSRSAIPFFRDETFHPLPQLMRHIGVYIFRKNFLMQYIGWDQTPFEKTEKLEQLRILENGYKIRVVKTEKFSLGIDTPEDVAYIKTLIQNQRIKL